MLFTVGAHEGLKSGSETGRKGVDGKLITEPGPFQEAEKPAAHTSARIAVQRLTQRTVKFIRWLRNHLDLQRDWDHAIAKLARIYSQP